MLDSKYTSFIERLKKEYKAMDLHYSNAAKYYDFKCKGCIDNCCMTRFYHHTHAEYYYILEGFYKLNKKTQTQISQKAENICKKYDKADISGKSIHLMCPLNIKGLCILYEYRPMICRLHGISHELKKPQREIEYSPGCDIFTKQTKNKPYFKFDRTQFYINMAIIEKDFKHHIGINIKFKKTIAQMLLPT